MRPFQILYLTSSSVLLLFHDSAVGADCSFEPVEVPIRSVPLPNEAAIRGIALGVGNPLQNLSFLPIVDLNNTWLYTESGVCADDYTDEACLTARGGSFIRGQSSTFRDATNALSAGGDSFDNDTVKSAEWGTDSLRLSADVVLEDFPLGVAQEDLVPALQTTRVPLGLGSNSTIISMLKGAGRIGSRTWSLWWGLDGAEENAQMDGSLVFGGYDAAKIQGTTNHTDRITVSALCSTGLTVTISEISLNFPNGSTPNLLNPLFGSTLIQACISFGSNLMTLPLSPYYERFEAWTETTSITRSVGNDFFTMTYPTDSVYQGDLTIKLDSGLAFRIPNSQLVKPDIYIADSGRIEVNDTVRNVMIYSLQDVNENDLPRLGRYFLTAAYLMVNYDTETFTLWEANPTTETELVAVGGDASASCTSNLSANASDASGSQSAIPRADGSWSAGQIAGAVIGILAGLTAVSLLAWWFFRRRKSTAAVEVSQATSQMAQVDALSKPQESQELWSGPVRNLAPSERLAPQELWAGDSQRLP